jgi:hypothetical protein
VVNLIDGRTISVLLAWYPWLLDATAAEWAAGEPSSGGFGIHGLDVDEHLNTDGLLRGVQAPRTSARVTAQSLVP